jgi:hypothetical protein
VPSEYQVLKREAQVERGPLLDVFEKFLRRARPVTAEMEWSWKFRGQDVQGDRICWLGAGGRREDTAHLLKRLAAELGFNPRDLPWRDLLERRTNRALVGYAGPDAIAGRPAAIKICLSLDPLPQQLYSEAIRAAHPGLPAESPSACSVVLCHALYESGHVSSRVYLMYAQRAFRSPNLAAYLSKLAGKRAVELARLHPGTGIAFKHDTTDTLGFAFRPTGLELRDHPSWWSSPTLGPILYAAGRVPALRARLGRMSWVMMPLKASSLKFPLVMREMSVYVRFGQVAHP